MKPEYTVIFWFNQPSVVAHMMKSNSQNPSEIYETLLIFIPCDPHYDPADRRVARGLSWKALTCLG